MSISLIDVIVEDTNSTVDAAALPVGKRVDQEDVGYLDDGVRGAVGVLVPGVRGAVAEVWGGAAHVFDAGDEGVGGVCAAVEGFGADGYGVDLVFVFVAVGDDGLLAVVVLFVCLRPVKLVS